MKHIQLLILSLYPAVAAADSDPIPTPTPVPARVPGEEVTTGSGKKMRVWDTSGPVPVNTEAPSVSEKRRVGDVNVWVPSPARKDGGSGHPRRGEGGE